MSAKTIVRIQIILLVITMVLGVTLTKSITSDVKLTHKLLGVFTGLFALAAVYRAYKDKAPSKIIISACAATVFTFLSGLGGKVTESNYNSGLLLMRIAAFLALASAGATLYYLAKTTK